MSNLQKEKYEISVWEDRLIPQQIITNADGSKKIIREHFEEYKGAIIGANDMDTPFAAANPTFTENVNGQNTLTFTMYYKCFDSDVGDFVINPFTALLSNERKIKLFFHDKWYDMVIKNCVEDSSAYSFTYTAKSLYTVELSKNGFKVELESDLENNQGTIVDIAETILSDTDWEVAPIKTSESDTSSIGFSDIIVETKIEPIYTGILTQDISVKKVNNYTPDEYANMSDQGDIKKINKGKTIFFFYSDIVDNVTHPHILYRIDNTYEFDINEDIITNSYNYRIEDEVFYYDSLTKENTPSIVESDSFAIFEDGRGEKVVRSIETGYDPDTDKFIEKFTKGDKEYYGYAETKSLTSNLAQNYLSNSDDYLNVDTGWIFDGTPTAMDDAGNGTVISDLDSTFTGQIYLLNQQGFSYDSANDGGAESVLVMRLRNGKSAYKDAAGDFYGITYTTEDSDGNEVTNFKSFKINSVEGRTFESNIRYKFKMARENGETIDSTLTSLEGLSDSKFEAAIESTLNNYRYSMRERRAINTGVAANRKIISTLTKGEEYVFAVSLGQYEEGSEPPEYGSEIKYGAKNPTEYFTFREAGADEDEFKAEIITQTYIETVYDIVNNPEQFLEIDSSGNIINETYVETYDAYIAEKEAEYEANYLRKFGLISNLTNPDIKAQWERGGSKYREYFKQLLANETTSSTLTELAEDYTEITAFLKAFYDQLKETLDNIIIEADKYAQDQISSNPLNLILPLSWKSAGSEIVDGVRIYPTYIETENELSAETVNSFTANLCYDIYNYIRKNTTLSDDYSKVIIPSTEVITTQLGLIYDSLVAEIGLLGSWEYARAYKMPSILDQNGGYKYQEFRKIWEEEAHSVALAAIQGEMEVLSWDKDKNLWTPRNSCYYAFELDENDSVKLQDSTINYLYQLVDPGLDDEPSGRELVRLQYNNEVDNSFIGTDEYYEGLDKRYWENEGEITSTYIANNISEDNLKFGHLFLNLFAKHYAQNVTGSLLNATYTLAEENYEVVTDETGLVAVVDMTNGTHVYDNGYLRLFDETKDSARALWLPVKDSNGDFIYDEKHTPIYGTDGTTIVGYKGQYREFHNWYSTLYYNPDTQDYKNNATIALKGYYYGDIIHHQIAFFDGKIGAWDEIPQRYKMVRTFIDPNSGRTYSSTGEQLDYYCEDDNGEYIIETNDPTSWLNQLSDKVSGLTATVEEWFSEIGNDIRAFFTGFKLGTYSEEISTAEEQTTEQVETQSVTSVVKKVLGFVFNIFSTASDVIEQVFSNLTNIGSTTINNTALNKIFTYLEILGADVSSVGILTTNVDKDDSDCDENNVAIILDDAQTISDGYYGTAKPAEVLVTVIDDEVETTTSSTVKFVKYRWWYWRHIGKTRYTLKPKLCVRNREGSTDLYHVYNCLEDADATSYTIKTKGSEEAGTYESLNPEPKVAYRLMTDTDFQAKAYVMIQDSSTDESHYVYDEEGYYRLYTDDDKVTKLFDGVLGNVCPTYSAVDSIEYEGTDKELWVLSGDIYIPYDARSMGITRQFRRIRQNSAEETNFVLYEDKYITLKEYWDRATTTNTLDYSDLKISFIDNYEYDAGNFAVNIEEANLLNGTQDLTAYLQFNLSNEPSGYFDTTVTTNTVIETGVKERWVYWKSTVNKSFSMTENLLSSIGMLFECAADTETSKDYAFLGMQLFKYIPYIKSEPVITYEAIAGTEIAEKLNELCQDIWSVDYSENLTENEKRLLQQYAYSKNYELQYTADGIILQEIIITKDIQPLIPGQAPDAQDLITTDYYIYDPDITNDLDSIVYEYVGTEPQEQGFEYKYDDLCQKIRSIKGKESNYYNLLKTGCEIFDCWMEIVVPHDENGRGRVVYVERPIYVQITDEADPIIYFNELPTDADESEFELQYLISPLKGIKFKQFVGKKNYAGFKYGINLKHIKRTLDSESITTRIIVKANSNEHATDNFCTIQRATENPIKESFIYDFSYYINKGMLKYSDVLHDLYTGVNSKLNYYGRLARLNKEMDQLAIDIAALSTELTKVEADYETCVLGRDAALEEITNLSQILTSYYDTYGVLIDTPWTYNKSKEYVTRSTINEVPKDFTVSVEIDNGVAISYDITEGALTTEIEYPKYNDTLRTYFDQMDTYQRNYINYSKKVKELEIEKERLEKELNTKLEEEQCIIDRKLELNKLFFQKYARYIQEGSWISEDYIDDNLYYLDALSVLRTSCVPKITYDIGVVDINAALSEDDVQLYDFEIGDRTYVEDTEFFGYIKETGRPYHEQVVVSDKTYKLEDPSGNQTKVKNYSTQFDNLFQRISATSQTLQFNEGSYGRVSSVLNSDGTINSDVLQSSVTNASLILKDSINENVIWDNTGITVTSDNNTSNVVKIVSKGILLSSDGGNTYSTAITGDGVNAAVLTSGQINTDKLLIGATSTPNFLWNKFGISAFKTDMAELQSEEDKVDYSTFVRFDQYGLYGIRGWSKNNKSLVDMSINDTFEPLGINDIINNDKAVFGLTWDGFFLNSSDGGRGRVTIGTGQDMRMSVFNDKTNSWQDRVLIGRMEDINNFNEYLYGFRLLDNDNNIVMDTNQRGELYLKNKLRISNFANESRAISGLYNDGNGGVLYNEEKQDYVNTDDRVTLGIVDIYDRLTYSSANITDAYSSSDYLTKVLSIKVNATVGEEQFTSDIITKLISKNETFAIFDNGNLYAKNAWVEGNIRATSGDIIGELEIGPNVDGKSITINGYNGTIGVEDMWVIDANGNAIFNNGTFRGKIASAVFEYNTIQAIGGAMLVAPTYSIKIKDKIENIYRVILENAPFNNNDIITNEFVKGFEVGNYCYISDNLPENEEKADLFKITEITFDIEENTRIYHFSPCGTQILNIEKEYKAISLGKKHDNPDEQRQVTLGINSTDNQALLPMKSFSVFETEIIEDNNSSSLKTTDKVILGYLEEKYASMAGGNYGLYTENAYLKGSLLFEDGDFSAGVTSKKIFNQLKFNDKIKALLPDNIENTRPVFWAGKVENSENSRPNLKPIFCVNENGYMVATAGYFSGEIVAATIKASNLYTANVYGFEDQHGINIYGDNGILFTTLNSKKIYELTKEQSQFYNEFVVLDNNRQTLKISKNIINLFTNDNSSLLKIQQKIEKEVFLEEIEIIFEDKKKIGLSYDKIQFEDSLYLGQKSHFEISIDASTKQNIGYDLYID